MREFDSLKPMTVDLDLEKKWLVLSYTCEGSMEGWYCQGFNCEDEKEALRIISREASTLRRELQAVVDSLSGLLLTLNEIEEYD